MDQKQSVKHIAVLFLAVAALAGSGILSAVAGFAWLFDFGISYWAAVGAVIALICLLPITSIVLGGIGFLGLTGQWGLDWYLALGIVLPISALSPFFVASLVGVWVVRVSTVPRLG